MTDVRHLVTKGPMTEARVASAIARDMATNVNASAAQSSEKINGEYVLGNELLVTVTDANGAVNHFRVAVTKWEI